jgi:ribonuclease HI
MKVMKMNIVCYTDGACAGNPGPGGWGYLAVDPYTDKIIATDSGRKAETTNNEMELTALYNALEKYAVDKDEFFYPIIYTDSNYAYQTILNWMEVWASQGWTRAGNKPVANLDLIKKIYVLWQVRRADLRWVKGHNGNKYNELADKLATGKLKPQDILD